MSGYVRHIIPFLSLVFMVNSCLPTKSPDDMMGSTGSTSSEESSKEGKCGCDDVYECSSIPGTTVCVAEEKLLVASTYIKIGNLCTFTLHCPPAPADGHFFFEKNPDGTWTKDLLATGTGLVLTCKTTVKEWKRVVDGKTIEQVACAS